MLAVLSCAVGGSYYVYISHYFSVPANSTPGSGGQAHVTVSEQTNRHNDDEAACV